MASFDESYADNNSDEKYISTNNIEEIWDGNYVHPDINSIYAILKIRGHIRQAQSDWNRAEFSEKSMRKVLQRFFKVAVK